MSRTIDPFCGRPRVADYDLAAWSLILPSVRSILCLANHVPGWLHDLPRRGVHVDLLANGRSLMPFDPHPESVVTATPIETQPQPHYDLAVLWDPSTASDLEIWLAFVEDLASVPDELVIWSRNPWSRHAKCRSAAPSWLQIDRRLRKGSWKLGTKHLGLPTADRLRQVIDWRAYATTPLLEQRRRRGVWKKWVVAQPLYRWLLPVRMQRATRRGKAFRPTALERILDSATTASGLKVELSNLQVSPNGVAIAHVQRGAAGSRSMAVLKVPVVEESKPRVDNNAAALRWMAEHAMQLGVWAQSPPRLLGRGNVGGWTYTLEERVEGNALQRWPDGEAEAAMSRLVDFLEILADLGQEPGCSDPVALERHSGAHLQRVHSLLAPDLAQRLQEVWEWVIQTLDGAAVPLVPRHGDFKLENVLGHPSRLDRLRLLDWELWVPRGLPLLDVLHLVVSRRQRKAGVSMGEAIRRWLLQGEFTVFENDLIERLSSRLDPRYLKVVSFFYWMDRVGPIAARGSWPSRAWMSTNVAQTLEAMHPVSVEVGA